MSRDSLLKFPTDFPIKAMGRSGSNVRALALAIVEKHVGKLAEDAVRERTSTDGNFLAVTFMVRAENRVQLDEIYRELTACEAVLMAL
jgi:uncharacterized protein